MRTRRRRSALLIAGLLAMGDRSYAAGPAIEHKAVSCIVAGAFPRLDACFMPVDELSRARVHFRADGTEHWYFVDMAAAGSCRSALLPKPLPSTKAIDYYVSALGRTFDETRTSEYGPRVVAREGDCDRDLLVAGSASAATVVLGAVAGAAATPPGFSPEGIVAAPASGGSSGGGGGGGGGGAVVLLGLAALGAGGYFLYKGLSEDEPDDLPPPPPFDGDWAGTTSQNRPLAMTVSGSGLTRFESSVDTGTSPNAPGRVIPIQRTFSPALPLSPGGVFRFEQPGEPPFTVTGTLTSEGTGDGRIDSGQRLVVTWRATRR